jgi:cell division protein FtsQ
MNKMGWVKSVLWAVLIIGIFVLMAFIDGKQESKVVGLPEIDIEVTDDLLFLTNDQVLTRLADRGMIGENFTYSDLQVDAIEAEIQGMPEVRTVDVYVYVSGKWTIDISLREPIARIFNRDSSSCYLDRDGRLMPLSESYTARVMTINGNVNETNMGKNVTEIINNDSLKTIEILDELYAISTYVCSDEFLSAQITHVFVNQFNEFEMIPRVGDQRILFGDGNHIAGKFKKLEYFYLEGISRAGWENFDTLDIRFLDLVYASER